MIVNVDETIFYCRKYHFRRNISQLWMVGGICRKNKPFFVIITSDRTNAMMKAVLEQLVEPGTIILIDQGRTYDYPYIELSIIHNIIKHFVNYIDSIIL